MSVDPCQSPKGGAPGGPRTAASALGLSLCGSPSAAAIAASTPEARDSVGPGRSVGPVDGGIPAPGDCA